MSIDNLNNNEKNPRGRPFVSIDWSEVEYLLQVGCSATEIASTLGISEQTLRARCKAERTDADGNYLEWQKYKQIYSSIGNQILRKTQYELATIGKDKTMLIWLGKNRLKQMERQEVIQTIKKIDSSQVTEAEAEEAYTDLIK